jgi:hypothetical protein
MRLGEHVARQGFWGVSKTSSALSRWSDQPTSRLEFLGGRANQAMRRVIAAIAALAALVLGGGAGVTGV